ncbi:MAG TPA: toll/interleukin-1 receptor domain-containing protein [Steroidobacteraceae bacterium]|nr:toll/interleukin-1 receptor domain-containing protein [Steroidobacteraceae bacterium]
MSSTTSDPPSAEHPPTVFLSYASADREAARVLKDALPTLGLEVWYDESDLGGGEIWDQKIRKQIRECDYFMPLISAQTEARHEGYFRREWRLAVERTLDMADDHAFLLPVVLDDTSQAGARVPEKFLSVQWVRVPGGQANAALQALCRRLVSGEPASMPRTASPPRAAAAVSRSRASKADAMPQAVKYPDFPPENPSAKTRYAFQVAGWALRSAWIFFNQLPRWLRGLIYVWLSIVLLSRGCSSGVHPAAKLSRPNAEELHAISDRYHGSFDKKDISKLAAQIARITSDGTPEIPVERSPLLAIPFTAPAGNTEAAKMADSVFALVYGKIAIANRGRTGLSQESAACDDSKAAVERGRANHSAYVLCGAIGADAAAPALTVKILKVGDAALIWSKSYPVAAADPNKIAEEVNSHVPALDDD